MLVWRKKNWFLVATIGVILAAIAFYQPHAVADEVEVVHVDALTADEVDFAQTVLADSLASTTSQGPVTVGEFEQANIHILYDDPETWKHVIRYPDAAYIKLHFAALQLNPGDALTISDGDGNVIHRYPGSSVTTDSENGFWALSVVDDTAVVELRRHVNVGAGVDSEYYEAALAGTPLSELKIMIDQFARGYPEGFIDGMPSLSSTCGSLDRTDVACYANSHPTEFGKSDAVVRILVNGSSHCTGWRVTDENFLFTNEHCITSQSQLNQMEFWFGYQRPQCGTGGTSTPVIVTGDAFLIDDYTLDFALVTLDNFNTIESFGYLELDPRVPALGEEIYIPQHGAGNPKEFGIESDVNTPDQLCQVDMPIANGRGTNTDVGYMCDTTGGSSGSPVLSRDTHKVVALHHYGNSAAPNCNPNSSNGLNRGVRIDLIFPLVASYLPGGGSATPTPVPPTPTMIPPTATPIPPTPTPPPSGCTTYNGSGGLALGAASVNTSLNVSNGATIGDINVSVDADHAWIGDLSFTLAHNGTSVTIIDRPGVPASRWGCSNDDIVATLDDEAGTAVEGVCASGSPTINGTFSPNNALSAFDGQNASGTWTLTIADAYTSADNGTLNGWQIEVCSP